MIESGSLRICWARSWQIDSAGRVGGLRGLLGQFLETRDPLGGSGDAVIVDLPVVRERIPTGQFLVATTQAGRQQAEDQQADYASSVCDHR